MISVNIFLKMFSDRRKLMENKTKHLEMIRKTLSRNQKYSFVTKIFLLAALILYTCLFQWYFMTLYLRSTIMIEILSLAIVFTLFIATACLDAYFLQQIKRFTLKFDAVRIKDEQDIDFDMTIGAEEKNKKNGYARCLFASSVTLYYGLLFLAAMMIVIVIKYF